MSMDNLITIREASDLQGVSIKTLRRWEQQGKISSIRTPGGHRKIGSETPPFSDSGGRLYISQ